jgi:Transposase DDE domain
MRALRILQERLRGSLTFMHAKRGVALWRAVAGLLQGQRLWLTALGRSLPGETSDKHRIKAVDRLVGSSGMQRAVPQLYAALAAFLLRCVGRPVLLIDWTGADPGFAVLSAKVCFRGRALSICSQTFPDSRKCSPTAEREFLQRLAQVIPVQCRPILVTDAGFLFPWFDAVRAHGWDFIGRLRGRIRLLLDGKWRRLTDVHALATRLPRELGRVLVGRDSPRTEQRVILSGKPRLKGRRKLGRKGARRESTADHQRSAAAREPLVLVTSLLDSSRSVVDAYRMRMQIEETFRDLKSHRYGWSAEDIRSRDPKRIDVLLVVAAFASLASHIIGLAATERQFQRYFQANTVRTRSVFSTFFLGNLTLARGRESELPAHSLRAAMTQVGRLLAAAALDRTPRARAP